MTASRQILLAGVAVAAALGATTAGSLSAQTAVPVPAHRTYITADIYEEADALVFVRTDRSVAEPLSGWHVPGQPVGTLIGLVRPAATGTDVRVLDPNGRQVGTASLPPARVPIVTDQGIITLVETLHVPVRPHEIGFYALDGTRRHLVQEAGLALVKYAPQRDGRLVTVNQGPAADDRSVIVYAADGTVRQRYDWKGSDVPDVVVTPDTTRLVLLRQDLLAGTSTVTVLGPRNEAIQSHTLPTVYQGLASDDSRQVALVGQNVVAMLDAPSGALAWRTAADIDLLLAGGLRFDAASGRLMIVSAQRDQRAGRANLKLRSLDVRDGTVASTDLGTLGLGEAPPVLAIDTAPTGERRVMLQDRSIEADPEQ